MRFFGLGANVMQKMGVSTQLLQPGEIFQALQLGTIDATEFSMPSADLSLGFHQVAKFYYFPSWHQPTQQAQGKAIREIESKGVKLVTWDKTFLAAYEKAWKKVVVEQSAKSPEFKKAWDSLSAFRADYSIWRERGYLR